MPTQKNDALRREIDAAAEVLRKGGLILYPTDTVWGIGCDATNEEAVARIYALKRSQNKKSMLVLCASADMTVRYVDRAPGIAFEVQEMATSPLTLILPGAAAWPRILSPKRERSACVFPTTNSARGCCAVSAGRSSRPRPTSRRADAQTVAGDRPRDRRRSGLRGQPPFRRAADRKAQFDHRLHRRRRCESHPPIAMPRTIRTEIQKRFSDIDSFRHVNNVSQQMYFDVGKSDFFDRLLGPEILFAPVRIITAATDTSYMGQIRFEDRIAVTTCVERIGTKSLTLLQRIVADDGTVRSQSRSVMVAFDFEAQQSVPVPDAWRRALEAE